MRKILTAVLLFAVAAPGSASHLSEAEVIAMEKACDKLRKEKLAPEKAAVLQQCLNEGSMSEADCKRKSQRYGETQAAPIRRPGKYYDLPECIESYQARKHYHVNPGR